MHRAVVVVVSALVVLTACSSDEDADEGASGAVVVSTGGDVDPVAGGSDPVPADTAPPGPGPSTGGTEPTTESTTGPDDAAADDVADTVAVELDEWVVEAPAEYEAGPVTFEVANAGTFTHELVVVRGDGYEALPLAANGSVIEDDLAEGDLLGRTPRIAAGDSETLTVELEPGGYVLLCNIVAGPSSHAAQGQWLAVRVG